MNIFLSYLLLGLSISAPIGPVNAAQIEKGIKNGFVHAWLIGIGAMMADLLYMVLVFFGVVHFINQPFVKTFLWLFGAFVLLYTGIESLQSALKVNKLEETRSIQSRWRTLITGFIMSVSSPLSVLFWLGIYGSVLAQAAAASGTGELILYSCGIIAGIMIWDVAMAGAASVFRRMMTPRMLSGISLISGLSLLAFGGYFGGQAIHVLFG